MLYLLYYIISFIKFIKILIFLMHLVTRENFTKEALHKASIQYTFQTLLQENCALHYSRKIINIKNKIIFTYKINVITAKVKSSV